MSRFILKHCKVCKDITHHERYNVYGCVYDKCLKCTDWTKPLKRDGYI